MKPSINYILIFILFFTGVSCVNSGMYNSSIGQSSNVAYATQNDTTEYREFELSKSKEETNSDFTLITSEKKDTTITEKVTFQKKTINEAQKDSLIFALIKDKSLTQKEKDNRLEEFIKNHNKEVTTFDTVINSTITVDTVFKADDELLKKEDSISVEKELQQKIDALQNQLDNYSNAKSKIEKKEAKQELKKTAWELRNMGKKDARRYHDRKPALFIPLSFLSIAVGIGYVSAAAGVEEISPYVAIAMLVGLLASFLSGIYFMLGKPSINWAKVKSKYKNDIEYKRGFESEAKARNRKVALFGFIPAAIILSIVLMIYALFLSL